MYSIARVWFLLKVFLLLLIILVCFTVVGFAFVFTTSVA